MTNEMICFSSCIYILWFHQYKNQIKSYIIQIVQKNIYIFIPANNAPNGNRLLPYLLVVTNSLLTKRVTLLRNGRYYYISCSTKFSTSCFLVLVLKIKYHEIQGAIFNTGSPEVIYKKTSQSGFGFLNPDPDFLKLSILCNEPLQRQKVYTKL